MRGKKKDGKNRKNKKAKKGEKIWRKIKKVMEKLGILIFKVLENFEWGKAKYDF